MRKIQFSFNITFNVLQFSRNVEKRKNISDDISVIKGKIIG